MGSTITLPGNNGHVLRTTATIGRTGGTGRHTVIVRAWRPSWGVLPENVALLSTDGNLIQWWQLPTSGALRFRIRNAADTGWFVNLSTTAHLGQLDDGRTYSLMGDVVGTAIRLAYSPLPLTDPDDHRWQVLETGTAAAGSSLTATERLVIGGAGNLGSPMAGTVEAHRVTYNGVDLSAVQWVNVTAADWQASAVPDDVTPTVWAATGAEVARTDRPDLELQVGGQPMPIRSGSLLLGAELGERGTGRVIVDDAAAAWIIRRHQPVLLIDRGVVAWEGFVEHTETTHDGVGNGTWQVQHRLDCIDNSWRADKRRITAAFTGPIRAGDVVRSLLDGADPSPLSEEGCAAGLIEDGPNVPTFSTQWWTVAELLQWLADAAGFVWSIDEQRLVNFHAPTARPAPFDLDWRTQDIIQRVSAHEGTQRIRTTQIVHGGTAQSTPRSESFVGSQQVDVRSFDVALPIDQTPTVDVNAVPLTVGIDGVDPEGTRDCYWNRGSRTVRLDPAYPPLGNVDVLTVDYIGQVSVAVYQRHEASIAEMLQRVDGSGASGLIDDAEQEGYSSLTEAVTIADTMLNAYQPGGATLQFRTDRSGLAPGMRVRVELPKATPSAVAGLHVGQANPAKNSAAYIVARVERFDLNGHTLWSDLTLRDRPATDTAQDFWRRRLGIIDQDRNVHTNTNVAEVVTILEAVAEASAWAEGVTATVLVCSAPAPTLLPSPSLLPC